MLPSFQNNLLLYSSNYHQIVDERHLGVAIFLLTLVSPSATRKVFRCKVFHEVEGGIFLDFVPSLDVMYSSSYRSVSSSKLEEDESDSSNNNFSSSSESSSKIFRI